ncbi:hypothetical protein GGQ64_004344 [Rhizobium azooxidifex]|uniref:Uncharacterized protein n=1 Tax=Mycoplana azooxidifex TaxID=1636188 RepID=A0A7W6DFY8_9HYPH|nr:hypothetical protein [Mycoplana azooxidifex]MBB3979108.1 hypothetical protein [Mycoplana azooxidifex]
MAEGVTIEDLDTTPFPSKFHSVPAMMDGAVARLTVDQINKLTESTDVSHDGGTVADALDGKFDKSGGTVEGSVNVAGALQKSGVNAALAPVPASFSAAFSVTAAHNGALVSGDATSGALACSLLSAVTAGAGYSVTIKKSGTGYNAVTITPAAGTIDGAATFVLRLPGQSVKLVSDGTNWLIADRVGEEVYGSNANGSFIRRANGVQECWNSAAGTLDTQTATGNIFRSGSNIIWIFPMAFNVAPTVNPACEAGTSRWAANDSPTTTQAILRQFASATSATVVNTTARAIGTWF